MTSVRRPYINNIFNQKVDDGCLEYKSIPMAVVNDLVKDFLPPKTNTNKNKPPLVNFVNDLVKDLVNSSMSRSCFRTQT